MAFHEIENKVSFFLFRITQCFVIFRNIGQERDNMNALPPDFS
uniref:Uncharacterized protein n=1 Tax=Anguilla anguilla TaxID=7936 RepID=A0A0E9QP79_ANGAN